MEPVKVDIELGVMRVVLNRPERKNALTVGMYDRLVMALDVAARDTSVKAVLLSGAGGVFTAGNDLADFVDNPPTTSDAAVFRFIQQLESCPKPVVAAVQGLAVGLGATMLLLCDLVYVASDARFSLPFVGLGLVPEAGSSLLLARAAGHQKAFEKMSFGEMFNATEAQELGFVNQILPTDSVYAHAAARAAQLAALPTGSVRGTKQLLRGRVGASANDKSVANAIAAEISLFTQRVTGPAALEAITAFQQKRKPNFADID